jgi:ATP/maltotriose-dependent transcriptional regulator MalT
LLQTAREQAEQTESHRDLALIRALELRLAVRSDASSAGLSLVGHDAELAPVHSWIVEPTVFSWARLALKNGSVQELRQATGLLGQFEALHLDHHDEWRAIQASALHAATLYQLGHGRQALEILSRAVARAAPGGLVRSFVDVGPSIEPLLEALARQPEAPEHVHRILAALREKPVSSRPQRRIARAVEVGLSDPLSHRELDVLELLEARLSNKEIASALDISSETVKKHAASLYRKLDASDRRTAVARAHELRLLSDTPRSA